MPLPVSSYRAAVELRRPRPKVVVDQGRSKPLREWNVPGVGTALSSGSNDLNRTPGNRRVSSDGHKSVLAVICGDRPAEAQRYHGSEGMTGEVAALDNGGGFVRRDVMDDTVADHPASARRPHTAARYFDQPHHSFRAWSSCAVRLDGWSNITLSTTPSRWTC